ncbi:RHS repeat domain-containing protein, partial [Mesonia sp. K4-1]|uniref:RHS repeat domain-containing protein n=1 Tax=Mesonia sp. K4-1 TaxID=2602760 RepID=UPI0011D8BC6C
YDELGNILQIQHIAQNGNWTRNYFYPNDSNQLLGHTSGQTDYTYDEAGNMLTMPHLNEMGWDEDDMLVEADLGGGGTAYYRYDSSGNRVRKVIVNGGVKKERLYVGEWELWQQSTNGTIETERETLSIADNQKSFLQLETLTIENGNTVAAPTINWRYQYDNHLGSACLELEDSANIISYEEYYPFGASSYRSGKNESEVKLKRYRYCGKERDEETGLYYYGARYYAAWIGRFISIDPLAEKFPQLTPYNYAGNKPITYKDLHGLQSSGGDIEVKTDNGEINNNAFPDTTGVQQLNEVVIITDSRGTDLTNSGYTQEDYRVRSKVLNDEGPVATALRSAEAKGIFRPLYDPSGHFDGFAENFAAGHKNFDPDGLANFWMNAAAFGIGIPLLAGVGGSYGGFQLSKSAVKPLFKMGVDATIQYTVSGDVDLIDVAASGVNGNYSLYSNLGAAGLDYSITSGYRDVFGNGGQPQKSLWEANLDFGTSFIPSLSGKMASPGNTLGPNGVDILGSVFSNFMGTKIKEEYEN